MGNSQKGSEFSVKDSKIKINKVEFANLDKGKSKLPIAVGAGVCAAAAVGAVIYGIARKKRKENND